MTRQKDLGLNDKINEIDSDIKKLKDTIEYDIAIQMKRNTDSLVEHMRRTEALEEYSYNMTSAFNANNRLVMIQTEQLTNALEKIQSELSNNNQSNQKLVKKSVPIITLFTIIASILLEVVKHFFK